MATSTPRAILAGLAPFAAALAAGFVLAYAAMYVLLPGGDATRVPRVPDLVGLPVDSARRLLERAGFAVQAPPPVPHPTVREGVVVTQVPAAGREADPGSAVSLVVSAGNRRAMVPALLGLPTEAAVAALARVGLEPGGVEQRPSALARGIVLDTRPVPGTTVAMPGPVTLIVSGGATEVEVPDVLGLDLDAARAQLEVAGLVADSAGSQALAGAAPGSVISQAPEAGAAVPGGSRVRLVIARP